MSLYTIVGGDGKEYGPVTEQDLRDWIKQGRANANTQVREGEGNWQNLGTIPVFSDLIGGGSPPSPLTLSTPSPASPRFAPGGTPMTSAGGATGSRETVLAIMDPLERASTWMRIVAIVMILCGVMYVLSIWGIIIAWLPIWQGVLLWKAASRSRAAMLDGSEINAQAATESLKTYFTLMGVMILLGVIFTVGIFILALVLGFSGASNDWFQY